MLSAPRVPFARTTAQLDKPVRRNDAKVFLRELARELVGEISLATKVVVLLVVLVLIATLLYVGHHAAKTFRSTRQQVQGLVAAQNNNINDHNNQLANLNERIVEANRKIEGLNKNHSELKAKGEAVAAARPAAHEIWTAYREGICLIAGTYVLIDPDTGKPLRYPEVEQNVSEKLLTTGTRQPLTVEGNGPIFELNFVGTGFHVGSGYVLTNRHIAKAPWDADNRAQLFIASTGGEPRLSKLLAFFPGLSRPIGLRFRAASRTEDVAVCTLNTQNLPDIPTLPLDQQSDAVEIGKAVVTMGYPTGTNRILALLPEKEAIALDEEYGDSLEALLDQLASRKLVNPLMAQGHITDLYQERIVFDATTRDGSSGTPIFGESGKVVGITFAVFVDDGASNFALRIRGAIEPLRKAGWNP